MIDAEIDQETLLREAVKNDGLSIILRLALQAAIDAHAVAVADASHILKLLTIAKAIDGASGEIAELERQHAWMHAAEHHARVSVDKAVHALAEAEVETTRRFNSQAEG